ncbi:MAG: hypothetical protein KME28_26710 [Pelatocladus maniniholoensis HA4357-MV3]|jgi:hypothetical protein|uniref:Uncharacterized protein n=1 Tax=Pelatocladus maniniholoensis HA4357-MV3 TaxID=1117104 RepID=A0A9E3HDJ3_9NOST|nr:hypothetical protein [Pelatocladus maniniholoensis HA4357-MV3]
MLIKTTNNQQHNQSCHRPNTNLKYWMLFGLLASLAMHGFLAFRPGNLLSYFLGSQKATATTSSNTPTIPTKLLNNAPIPDWDNINFKSFVFSNDGSIELPQANIPGYKSKRLWKAGQSLDQVMELGDFEEVFGLENFSLEDIEKLSSISLKNIKLSDFSIVKWQTVPELVKAIPKLADEYVVDVPPIKDLVEQILSKGVTTNQTIGELIQQNPDLKDIELGEIDLSKYKLSSIPGIEKTLLKKFTNWQNATISKVPGLNEVSFNNFPIIPIPQGDIIGKVDLPLKEVENNRQRSISGSYQEGFNVPCSQNCAHIELSGQEGLTGAQWMSGKFQNVRGGYGILGKLNGGKEPTGRHPFGKAFKQVIWDVNEKDGSITTAMFFRICKRSSFVNFGCSPYFIGPFPFLPYKEKSYIFIGTPLNVIQSSKSN